MELAEQKVLVTGAGGFVGSHLVELLVSIGADVRCFVRYNSRNDPGLLKILPDESREQIEVYAGDLRDGDALRKAIADVDVVFHLGALIAIPYSYKHPLEVVETNTVGTTKLLLAAREAGVERFVHTSTSEVYGTAHYVPIDEDHPLQGQSPYSASKIGADKVAESFYHSYDFPVTTVRPFNIYGPRQSARAVIPTIITQALSSDELELGALTPTRDFTFVKDTVRGFIRAAEQEGFLGDVVNLGSNDEISIGDLARKIIGIVDRDVEIKQQEERFRPEKSEVDRLHADSSKAKELIGWEPTVSLQDGLEQTIGWIENHMEFYSPGNYVV